MESNTTRVRRKRNTLFFLLNVLHVVGPAHLRALPPVKKILLGSFILLPHTRSVNEELDCCRASRFTQVRLSGFSVLVAILQAPIIPVPLVSKIPVQMIGYASRLIPNIFTVISGFISS